MSSADRPTEGGKPAPNDPFDVRHARDEGDEFDRRIAAALDASFAPPKPRPLVMQSTSATPISAARPAKRQRFAIAALIALSAIAAAWYAPDAMRALFWKPPFPQGPTVAPTRQLEVVYRERIEAGFKPDWVCNDDKEFAETFRYRYGQKLHMAKLPDGMKCVGIAYATALSSMSTLILVEAGSDRIVLVVDRASDDGCAAKIANQGLHAHRRVIGDLVLYELSPREESAVLQHMSPET